ncbi:MAG TPA: hypothetical protein VM684_09080 [Gaiellales bacterium]|nr:hypothetical protein [Gaiellales bacterium]
MSAIVADVVENDTELHDKPIVGGAAAEATAQAATAADEDTPAARAADLGRRPSESADAPDDTDDDEDDGRRSRLPWVIGLVLVLVIAGIVGTFLYARTQYYVGASKSTPATVTIYRGVSGSVLGIDLSSVNQRTDIPVDALPDFEQVHLHNGIDASSQKDAKAIASRLRSDACPPPATTTTKPTPSPSPSPTPTPSAPSYCHG